MEATWSLNHHLQFDPCSLVRTSFTMWSFADWLVWFHSSDVIYNCNCVCSFYYYALRSYVHVISIYNLQVIAPVQCGRASGHVTCGISRRKDSTSWIRWLIWVVVTSRMYKAGMTLSRMFSMGLLLPADRSTAAHHTDMIRITKNPAPTSGLSSFFKVLEGNMYSGKLFI